MPVIPTVKNGEIALTQPTVTEIAQRYGIPTTGVNPYSINQQSPGQTGTNLGAILQNRNQGNTYTGNFNYQREIEPTEAGTKASSIVNTTKNNESAITTQAAQDALIVEQPEVNFDTSALGNGLFDTSRKEVAKPTENDFVSLEPAPVQTSRQFSPRRRYQTTPQTNTTNDDLGIVLDDNGQPIPDSNDQAYLYEKPYVDALQKDQQIANAQRSRNFANRMR